MGYCIRIAQYSLPRFPEGMGVMFKKYESISLLLGLLLGVVLASNVQAASAPSNPSTYVELSPSFVTNYDGGGRLRYLRVDVSVRIERPSEALLRQHMPYVRSRLVELFSSQLEENLTSTEGKEALRAATLEEIRTALDYVNGSGSEGIVDVFFTSYVIQQ
jgi:flagellar FliL protein